jgi:hypothetical protein
MTLSVVTGKKALTKEKGHRLEVVGLKLPTGLFCGSHGSSLPEYEQKTPYRLLDKGLVSASWS